MKKLVNSLNVILLLLFASFNSFAQCEIWDMVYDLDVCENGEFNILIDFNHANTSDSFELRGNGIFHGTFAYNQLPVTIGPLDGDCDTQYEFVAIDQLDDDCRDFVDVGEVCCDCRIYDLVVEASDCDDGFFFVEIDFLYENTGDEFEVKGNGENYGTFEYSQLPILIDGLDGDCETEYEFVICDKRNPDCREDFGLGEICCEEECRIYDLTFDLLECNGDSCLKVMINFEHEGTGGVGFDVFDRNGLIGFYSYNSLPLVIDCYPISGLDEEFVRVCDNDNPDCCAAMETPAIDCDTSCSIRDLEIDVVECDTNHTFFMILDFLYDNVSDSGYVLKVNDSLYGEFNYDSLPLTFGPLEGGCDIEYEVIVCDFGDSGCADTAIVDQPCCEEEPCEIGELVIQPTECDSLDMFYIEFDFDYARTSDSFKLEINDRLEGRFGYDELPLRLGPFEGDCETVREFLVKDCERDCASDGRLEEICCEEEPCEIGELVIQPTECDSLDMFYIEFDFDYARTSDSFKLEINDRLEGRFGYDELPLRLGPFEGDCETVREFLVKDCERDCASDGRLEEICCEEEPCEIGELVIQPTECDSLDMFYIEFDFDYARTSDSFKLEINDRLEGQFGYDELPLRLGPFEGDCETVREFLVKDCERDCASDGRLEEICCEEEPCEIGELVIQPTECDSLDMFYIEFDFDYARTSDSFKLEINDRLEGRFGYDELPLRLGPFEGDCETVREFLVKDCERDCASDGRLEEICCEEEECRLYELEFDILECNGDSCIVVEINFEHEGTGGVGFDVFDRNGLIGFYSYNSLPLVIECYPISGLDEEFVRVCDNDNPDCCVAAEAEALDCTTSVTDIESLGWDVWYDFNQQIVHINYSGSGGSSMQYDLLGLGGQRIYTGEISGNHQITMDGINSGIYLLRVKTEGTVACIRLVVP